MAVRHRIQLERKIVRSLVAELLSHGFELAVFDGEEEHKQTTDSGKLLDQLMETDEDYLYVYPAGAAAMMGHVRLVYGNDGWDVMSDWTTNLDQYIPLTLALVEAMG